MRWLLVEGPRWLVRRLRELVLEGELPQRPIVLRWLLLTFRLLALAVMRFERDRGRERAAALAYSSLLALIPLVLLGVSTLEFLVAPGRLAVASGGALGGATAAVQTGGHAAEGMWLSVSVNDASAGLELEVWLRDASGDRERAGTMTELPSDDGAGATYAFAIGADEGDALPFGAASVAELAQCRVEVRTKGGPVAAEGDVPAPGGAGEATDVVLGLVFPEAAEDVKSGFMTYFDESRKVLEGDDSSVSIRVLSVILLVYFATSLMTSADRMVAAIWGTTRVRRLLPRLSAYWAVITLGPLLLAISFTGTALAGDILGADAGTFLRRLLPYGVTWVSVFLFYRLMPHTRVRTSAAISGAVVAGSLWEGSKQLMGWYLSRPKTLLTAMTIFPAALLWMYVSWVIAILGLEVAYVFQQGAWRPGRRAGRARLRGTEQDALVLAVAVEVALDFDKGRYPARDEIARRIGVGEDDVTHALDLLASAEIVEPHPESGVRPTRGTDGITALQVVRASRGRLLPQPARPLPHGAAVARDCVAEIEAQGARAVEDVTLGELARRAAAARDIAS